MPKDLPGPLFSLLHSEVQAENVVIVPERVTKKRKAEDLSTDRVATGDSDRLIGHVWGLDLQCLRNLSTWTTVGLFAPISSIPCRCPQTLTSMTCSCFARNGKQEPPPEEKKAGVELGTWTKRRSIVITKASRKHHESITKARSRLYKLSSCNFVLAPERQGNLGPTMWFTNTNPLPLLLVVFLFFLLPWHLAPPLLFSFSCSQSSIYSKRIFRSCKWRICSSKAGIWLNVSKGLGTRK